MTSCAVTVVNPLGLHARAAARFVHLAASFASAVRVGRAGREIDGKSILGLLLLSAARGCDITISADGPDEQQAMSALCGLVRSGFDELPAGTVQEEPFGSAEDLACDLPEGKPCI